MLIVRNKLTISMTLVAAILLASVNVSAQAPAPNSDWSKLNTVNSGSKLSVKLKSGQTIDGKLSAVSDTSLAITVKGKVTDVKREDVASVYQIKNKSEKKSTLIGLGVGAGAGAAIGLAGRNNDGFGKIENIATAGFAVLGGAAGALTGFLLGRSGSGKRVLIYQAN